MAPVKTGAGMVHAGLPRPIIDKNGISRIPRAILLLSQSLHRRHISGSPVLSCYTFRA